MLPPPALKRQSDLLDPKSRKGSFGLANTNQPWVFSHLFKEQMPKLSFVPLLKVVNF